MKTKEVKRSEAEDRNAVYRALSIDEKRDKVAKQPGNSLRQLRRLARVK